MNQTRRQFFKTLAATAAGVVAVGVAPRVVRGEGVDRSVVSPISDPGIKKTYMDVDQELINQIYHDAITDILNDLENMG